MDKAKERLDHLKKQYGENDPYYRGFYACLRLVEQNEGEWKINPNGWYPYCSNCGNEPRGGFLTNFCPECGVDMRGEKK